MKNKNELGDAVQSDGPGDPGVPSSLRSGTASPSLPPPIAPAHKPRCQARVYKRDTYRNGNPGRSRWKMHYRECQCKRPAFRDGWCAQHFGMKQADRYVVTYKFAKP